MVNSKQVADENSQSNLIYLLFTVYEELEQLEKTKNILEEIAYNN